MTLNQTSLYGHYPVTAAHVEEFRAKGHTSVEGLATWDEVESFAPAIEATAQRLNREARPLEERETYGKAFLQTQNLWRADERVKEFVFSPRFARTAAELMGVNGVRLYHDQALFKEPSGGRTPWHQDQFYWPLDTTDTVTMWMPLVDLPEEVGSMIFASGSHRAGDLRGKSISDQSDEEFATLVAEKGLTLETHGALKAGGATFHTGWTLHSAGQNPTNFMRKVMTVIYFAEGARVTHPESPFQQFDMQMWLPGTSPGDLAASEINPLLWSAETRS